MIPRYDWAEHWRKQREWEQNTPEGRAAYARSMEHFRAFTDKWLADNNTTWEELFAPKVVGPGGPHEIRVDGGSGVDISTAPKP